ncbi:MAG: protease inhibitor I42 family protein [Bacteroidia bacterium]
MKKYFLLVLFMASCFLGFSQITLTEANHDSSIIVMAGKGQSLVVKLRNNGGTAYAWKMTENNDGVLKFIKESQQSTVIPKEGEPQMVGTPYESLFSFDFTGSAGKSNLTFQLSTSWGDVAKTVNYRIVSKIDTRPVNNPNPTPAPKPKPKPKPKKKTKPKKKK